MKSYINLKLPGRRRLVLQKDDLDNLFLGLVKDHPIPELGKKYLEWYDKKTCSREQAEFHLEQIKKYGKITSTFPDNEDVLAKLKNIAKTYPAEYIKPYEPLSPEAKERINKFIDGLEEHIIKVQHELIVNEVPEDKVQDSLKAYIERWSRLQERQLELFKEENNGR